MGARLTAAMHAGNVSLAKVDDSARRILTPMFAVGLFDAPNTNTKLNNVTSPEHNALGHRHLASRGGATLRTLTSLGGGV
jgi:beta-glucosidase-like glycosyl hydrolase